MRKPTQNTNIFSGLWLFGWLLASFSAYGQTWSNDLELYNTRDGLPHEHVSCITEDSRGFLWVGTATGLARYDGHEFDVFDIENDRSTHSYSRAISTLLSDETGIWVGTTGGVLAYLNTETQSWRYFDLPENGLYKPYKITCLIADQSTLYVGCFNGDLLELNKEDGLVNVVEIQTDPLTEMQLTNDHLSIGSAAGGWCKMTLDGKHQLNVQKENVALTKGAMASMEVDGIAWTSVTKDLGRKFFPQNPRQYQQQVLSLTQGFVLIGEDRISLIDAEGEVAEEYPVSTRNISSMPSLIQCAFHSKNGVLWLGTNVGLIKAVRSHFTFEKYRKQPIRSSFQVKGALPFNYVRSIYAHGNEIWLGSKLDNVLRTYHEKDGQPTFEVVPIIGANTTVIGSTVNTFLQHSNGDLLAGGVEGVFILGDEGFRSHRVFNENMEQPNIQVWTLIEDQLGRVWIGTLGNGILVFDPSTSTTTTLVQGGPEGLSSNTVWHLINDPKGCIWAGTNTGLDSIAYSDSQITCTPLNELLDEPMDGREVWHMEPDAMGNLWLGTTDNGLSFFDRKKRTLRNYHKADGLENETIAGMSLQEDGKRLWLSTRNGLFALDIKKQEFTKWTIEDGLLSNEFNFKAHGTAPDGSIYLGTKSGLMSFNPQQVYTDTASYSMEICQLRLGNELVKAKSELTLPPNTRQFSAKFSLLDFAAPKKHQFRYKLLNLEDDWTYTDRFNRLATYTNLAPGTYQLLIEGSVTNKWKTAGSTQLTVDVPSKLVEEIWFRTLLALLILTVVIWVVRMRFTSIKERARLQVKMAELERRMLTAQMSPHFLFNSMNAIQQFVLSNDARSAQIYLSKFSKLIRMFLEASKDKLITLQEELKLLDTYIELERLRFENRFEVSFEIEGSLALEEIEIPNSILQPFVENAIIHGLAPKGKQGLLLIRMWEENRALHVWIDDDGVGRSANSRSSKGPEHTPQGMNLASELARSYSDLDGFPDTKIQIIDKVDEEGRSMGTRIIIKVEIC